MSSESTEPASPRAATAETGETLLDVRNLKKYYEDGSVFSSDPVQAVDGVSFSVQKGETLGIVGESGCGKTTLGRTVIGLESATEGEVIADGRDVTALSGSEQREWQRDAQMVFQDPDSSLNDRMTVGQIIAEPLEAHDWGTKGERRERVFELLDLVGLREEHYYRYPHQFSGGQRQRIGIARALALEPEFMVLDEPVSALDVSVQARIINLLDRLQEELGLTYLFIAHDLSVVRHICDRVGVMYLGNLVELGPTEELFTDPAHPYTISLLSAIPGKTTGTERQRITLRGTPPSPRDPPAGCSFATRCPAKVRPDEFELSEEAWERVEAFHQVYRARHQAEASVLERVRQMLGRSARGDVTEIRADLFGDVSLDANAREVIDRVTELGERGADGEAAEVIREEFGSVCNEQDPAAYDVGVGRRSRCVRHEDDYEDPVTVVARRRTRAEESAEVASDD